MEVTTKKRIAYFDIAKGVLIILLVFAHFRSAVVRIPYDSPYFEMVYGWNHLFTCFYMPAFFIISGYCSSFNKSFSEFSMSLIKKLLVPLATFTVLTQAISSLINRQNFFELLFSEAVLWFLWAMMIAKLIFYGVKRVMPNGGGGLVVTLILMVVGVFLNQWNIGSNPFFYKHALISTFWIAVGAYLKENPVEYERCLKGSLFAYPVVAAATFIKSPSLTASIAVSVVTIPIHIVYSLVGTLFLLKICSMIGENKTLEYWGKNSLVVYALHFYTLLVLTRALWKWLRPENGWSFILFFVLLYTFEYLICWLFIKLFSEKPFSYLAGKF